MIITTVSGNKVSVDVFKVINVQESWHESRRCAYIAMDNKQGFSVFDTVEAIDALIQREKGIIPDDPADDCTPNQHPAFIRGQEYNLKAMCRDINEILDGKSLMGKVADPDLQALRERLACLAKSAVPTMVSFTQQEIQSLKHMLMMTTPLGGPRT